MCKSDKYIYWVNKDLFGCFRERGERDKGNETGLKEGGRIKMSTTVLPLRDACSLRFCIYLPCISFNLVTILDIILVDRIGLVVVNNGDNFAMDQIV